MSLTESEFASLRHTITLRGTVRMALLPAIVAGWATLVLALVWIEAPPVTTAFTLLVLAAGFEAIHALHIGAERIGRYLQVYYESAPDAPQWETTAMRVGPALPGGGIDPLFTVVFVLATVANLFPASLIVPTPGERVIIVLLHLAFVVRVVRARGAAARQRAVELESYRAIHSQTPTR